MSIPEEDSSTMTVISLPQMEPETVMMEKKEPQHDEEDSFIRIGEALVQAQTRARESTEKANLYKRYKS